MASQSGYHDAGSSGFRSYKLGPRDLPSKRLLGTGLASVGYETELNGKKCARKDFMGVPSSTFRREAVRLLGLEDHINVVKTLGWTENNMSCSLVLEYMDDDLLGFLQKRKQGSLEAGPSSGNQSDLDSRNKMKLAPLELPEALDIMLQIARGMEYLADNGIRHGNLKTKNVLVSYTNDRDRKSVSVKVADFGLVRTRRKSTSFASRRARKLDMARWTAPELLQVFLLEDKGETSSESDSDDDCIDSSDFADSDVPEWRELGADVYSFAVTCSQILTGEDPYPYPNLNWKELGVNVVRHGLTPTLPAACPPKLRELLVTCWGCDGFCHRILERPSFSHIRTTLERLQQRDLPAQSLHESLPRAEKVPMDIKRKDQLRVPMPGKEPTDVVREIGLRQPITVEDLWGPEDVLHVPAGASFFSMSLQMLIFSIPSLIARTRTVVSRHTEWTQLREELERMLPGMLRIRNRWTGCEKAWDGEGLSDRSIRIHLDAWSSDLHFVVRDTLHEVGKYQQHDKGGLLLMRVLQLRNDINQLAKERTEILLDLTRALRQAQRRAKEKVKRAGKREQAKAETGVSSSFSSSPGSLEFEEGLHPSAPFNWIHAREKPVAWAGETRHGY